MDYIFVSEAAQKWEVSVRQAQRLLRAGRIPGAMKREAVWLIPAEAKKPADPRTERKRDRGGAPRYICLPSMSFRRGGSEAVGTALPERYRALAEADLAYRRGDPRPAKQEWMRMDENDERMLSVTILATVTAISSGDYALYHDITAFLRGLEARTDDKKSRAMLSLPEALAAVSMAVPDMTPDWLKRCDFSLFPDGLAPFLLNLYTMHLRNIKDRYGVLATARASIILCAREDTFTWIDLNNHLLCAAASFSLGDTGEARRSLLAAMELGLPYGMIVPFADGLGTMGGLTEECLNAAYLEYLAPVRAQWETGFKNWMSFHNKYARENISTVLSAREYQIAHLIADGASYAQAACRMNLSTGRIKNILSEVYAKLCIGRREQLKDCIL